MNEDVTIEIYKGDVLAETIETVPSNGAYSWQVNTELETGQVYSIKIKSSADETICDTSDKTFSIVD